MKECDYASRRKCAKHSDQNEASGSRLRKGKGRQRLVNLTQTMLLCHLVPRVPVLVTVEIFSRIYNSYFEKTAGWYGNNLLGGCDYCG